MHVPCARAPGCLASAAAPAAAATSRCCAEWLQGRLARPAGSCSPPGTFCGSRAWDVHVVGRTSPSYMHAVTVHVDSSIATDVVDSASGAEFARAQRLWHFAVGLWLFRFSFFAAIEGLVCEQMRQQAPARSSTAIYGSAVALVTLLPPGLHRQALMMMPVHISRWNS
jgi:hypothetical protein